MNDAQATSNLEATLRESIRVRNLLARTAEKEESLEECLINVLPACLQRLDQVSVALYSCSKTRKRNVTRNEGGDKRLLQQIQGHTIGCLAHAMQRLRNSNSSSVHNGNAAATLWVLAATQQLAKLQSSISRTLAISLVGIGIPRVSPPTRISQCLLPDLLAFLEQGYRSVATRNEPTEACQTQLTTTSWVILDAIARGAGMNVFQDWERDAYQGAAPWNRPLRALNLPTDLSSGKLNTAMLDLLMDVFLFWPATQHDNMQQQEHVDNSTGMSIAGLGRLNHRCKSGSVAWNDIYLRHIKYACAEFAWRQTSGQIPKKSSDGRILSRNNDREILLAVLAAAANSMHGRLAYEYIAQMVGPHAFDESYIVGTTKSRISWSLAIDLLILVLGQDAALPVLDKYPNSRDAWQPLLGVWPKSSRYRRAPLPTDVSSGVIHFLCNNLDPKCALESLDSGDDLDSASIALYLDLAVQTQDPRRPTLFWGIDLLTPYFRQLCQKSAFFKEETKKFVCSRLLATSVSALETVPSGKATFVDDLVVRDRQDPLPLGVPEEYANREDLNGLLHKHRAIQRKRALLSCEATEARKRAYQMIAESFRLAGVPEKESLLIPTSLFLCIASEHPSLAVSVVESLREILADFKKARFDQVACDKLSGVTFAATLLPSLICAAVSESDYATSIAREWTEDFLAMFDFKMAGMILAFLEQPAKGIGARQLLPDPDAAMMRSLDLSTPVDRNEILCELLGKVKSLSTVLSVSPAVALALLSKLNFSIASAREEFRNDPVEALQQVGMTHRERKEDVDFQPDTFCRICFSDLTSDRSFALACGHRFCTSCWKLYLDTVTQENGKNSLSITCPDHKCTECISIFEADKIDTDISQCMCNDLVLAYVKSSRRYTICPKTDCKTVVYVENEEEKPQTMVCQSCKHRFCFDCGGTPHEPAACCDLERWNEIFGSSSFWIKKHARPCPSCAAPIEKSGGCNHIRCQQCGADWCWICQSYLRSHNEAHVCNRYDPAANADKEQEEERRSIFYTDRYRAHEDAESVAKQRNEFIRERKSEIKEGLWYCSDDENELYLTSFSVLTRTRSFLKYSYVVAWCQQGDTTRFENQQAILEVATEKLTQLTMARLDEIFSKKGYSGIQFVFRSMDFLMEIIQECMSRLTEMVL